MRIQSDAVNKHIAEHDYAIKQSLIEQLRQAVDWAARTRHPAETKLRDALRDKIAARDAKRTAKLIRRIEQAEQLAKQIKLWATAQALSRAARDARREGGLA